MHDDGRYDDPRVNGRGERSAAGPVSRETDEPGWPGDAYGAAAHPIGGGSAPRRDAPVAAGTGTTAPRAEASGTVYGRAGRPGVPAADGSDPGLSAHFESTPRPAVVLPQQPAPHVVPDAAPGAAVPVDTPAPPAGAYGTEPADAAYVSRETPTREEDDPPLAMEAMRAVQILNPSGEVTMPRPERTRVMCVANQKGGVGKTTTTVNLAVALALHGNRVLVVDLDPQGNASTGLNVPHHTGVPDVYDCLINSVPLEEVAQGVEGIPNLWCVPATIDLAGAEIELVSVVARESRLSRAIDAYPGHFDYVFIDCPPSLGLLTVNALVAAQEVLIPIQCEYYALEGLNQLINNINLVRKHLNPRLDVSTILLTMYDRRTRLADAVEQDVRNHFGDKVLQAVIPRNVRVSEAPSYGQSVMTYDPGSRGATSYFEAAQEIAERGVKEPVSRNA
ncbi:MULTISPECIES: ParA family protein [Micromonospora]|uniref:ParA family protein n=1 Tax=Micromonospora TaxID=1873 RepID=UPI0009E65069|nr:MULTISPECIES: AAA family ATPase [Micromonospora]